MIVVSDTSPINYLCQLGHIDILPQLFGRVVVPHAVMLELSAVAAPQPVQAFTRHVPDWLEIRSPGGIDSSLDNLGLGERQAIALAQELSANLLIADDKLARLTAERRQIDVMGTLGILMLAADKGLLQLAPAIAGLRSFGFYLSDAVAREILSG